MNPYLVYAIGFIAQGFFSARILTQWILSERAKKVLSPNIFWIFSLTGSVLLFIYGWLRDDFSIIFGQLITYYIYISGICIQRESGNGCHGFFASPLGYFPLQPLWACFQISLPSHKTSFTIHKYHSIYLLSALWDNSSSRFDLSISGTIPTNAMPPFFRSAFGLSV